MGDGIGDIQTITSRVMNKARTTDSAPGFVGETLTTVMANTIGSTTTDPALTKNPLTIQLISQPLTKLKLWKKHPRPTVQPRKNKINFNIFQNNFISKKNCKLLYNQPNKKI